jgi:hypothetical protein
LLGVESRCIMQKTWLSLSEFRSTPIDMEFDAIKPRARLECPVPVCALVSCLCEDGKAKTIGLAGRMHKKVCLWKL